MARPFDRIAREQKRCYSILTPSSFSSFRVTFLVFFWLGSRRHVYGAAWLTAASLFFYGWWNPAYVWLLLGSILFNYGVGLLLGRKQCPAWVPGRKALLTIGIAGDLGLLGYYKYANFFLYTINEISGTSLSLGEIVLPLGISFFTFTQIAFLVDTYQGKVKEQNFVHYALFVTYFPHLIAGPVLHHREMMPQFASPDIYRRNYDHIAVGLTFFAIGLFKKAVLADGIAPYANSGFAGAAAGQTLTLLEAWVARWPTRFSFTSIFPAIRTWRWDSPACSACACRSISIPRTRRRTSSTSGVAGT